MQSSKKMSLVAASLSVAVALGMDVTLFAATAAWLAAVLALRE
ncbi:hypothetical protein VWY34_02755 [Phaeobacter sp. JH20_02]